MEEKLKKMMEKKKARKLSPVEQKAKMGVLKDLKDDMSAEMGGSLKDMMAKKVSVMAGSKKDLERGLDKAKELVGHMEDGDEEGHLKDMSAEESGEYPAEEAAELTEEEMSKLAHGEEDVDSEIKMLEEKLKKLKAKKGEHSFEESEEE